MFEVECVQGRGVDLSKHTDNFFADNDIASAAVGECGVHRFSDRIGERDLSTEDVHRRVRLREVSGWVDADRSHLLVGGAVLDHIPYGKESLRELAVFVCLEHLHEQCEEVCPDHGLLFADRVKQSQGPGQGFSPHILVEDPIACEGKRYHLQVAKTDHHRPHCPRDGRGRVLLSYGGGCREGCIEVLDTVGDCHILKYVPVVEYIGPVTGDENPDPGVPVWFGAEPHPLKEPCYILGGEGEPEEGCTFLGGDAPLCRCKRGHHLVTDGDRLDRRPGLGERGAYDVRRGHHRSFIGAGAVEQDVLRRCRDPGQFTVDDRWEGEHSIVGIDDQWELGESLHQMGVVPALRMIGEDLIERHIPVKVQRDERATPRRGHVVEGRRDRIEVVDADCHLTPPAPDSPVESFLEAHQALDRLFIEINVPDHR